MITNIYNTNGLVFWSEKEIAYREYIKKAFSREIKELLTKENKAWQFFEIEAPILTPRDLVSSNYTKEDIWIQDNLGSDNYLVLRPETTPSSYAFAKHLLDSNLVSAPFVVEQTGKSFRREQDQITKHMRLKEFYQQEFQCIFSSDTLNDYHEKCLLPVSSLISRVVGLPTRVVESDRLPSYSLRTMDVEVNNGDKWMEICSISKRTDFTTKIKFSSKGGVVEKDLLVLEIAIGLDRCIYNHFL